MQDKRPTFLIHKYVSIQVLREVVNIFCLLEINVCSSRDLPLDTVRTTTIVFNKLISYFIEALYALLKIFSQLVLERSGLCVKVHILSVTILQLSYEHLSEKSSQLPRAGEQE